MKSYDSLCYSIDDVSEWMAQNWLKVNIDKSQLIWL